LATRIAHFNTGKMLDAQGDQAGFNIMKRVAADENLHYLFYRDLGKTAIELNPSAMVLAIDRQVRKFEMPGTGIVDFGKHAKAIARAGIYDYEIHYNKILVPVLKKYWGLDKIEGLSPEAEQAREGLLGEFMLRLSKAANRSLERKQKRQAQLQEA
ncbi:MAG: acyl-ACP desaturase, partial [Candidatus Saccharimonadales bacterium]